MFRMMSETIYPLFRGIPRGYAHINGSEEYSNIKGMVLFYPYKQGSVVVADIGGLPPQAILGFHIHEGDSCMGDTTDPFADAGMHYNMLNRMQEENAHPQHTGDMPVLFANSGAAWMGFYTERFTPDDVRGKTVIVHAMPDDFRTNPSGNSGNRIACGVIR